VTLEQFASIMLAFGGMIGALAALWRAVQGYHQEVNSKMDRLLKLTARASFAEGARSKKKPLG
jgi:hypothetical protein